MKTKKSAGRRRSVGRKRGDPLTLRTRLEYRYSTHPADFGYEGQPTRWRDSPPDAEGTINTIARRIRSALKAAGLGDGNGTYYTSEIRTVDGEVLSRDDRESIMSGRHELSHAWRQFGSTRG